MRWVRGGISEAHAHLIFFADVPYSHVKHFYFQTFKEFAQSRFCGEQKWRAAPTCPRWKDYARYLKLVGINDSHLCIMQ